MHDLEIRSGSAELNSAPELFAPVALSSSSKSRAESLGIGAILCLCGLGIAAVVTIFAFFGTGLLLLLQRPGEIARSAPPVVVVAKDQPAVSMPATTEPISLPARASKTGAQAAAPIAPLTQTLSAASRGTTLPAPPAPAAAADAMAAGSAANHALAPSLSPQQYRSDETVIASAAPVARAEAALSAQSESTVGSKTELAPIAPLPAAQIKALLAQGDDAFRRGDLASARLLYRRAYEAGDGRGALGIGASYDPLFLRQFRLWTQAAVPDEARAWYLRARDLGAPQVEARLKRLNSKSNR